MQELIKNLISCVRDIQLSKKEYSDIYKIHKYWARKPWNVVAEFIAKYSKEDDLVIDPFCGSGLTGMEAILQNRRFLGIDLNPMATTITEGTLKFCNPDELKEDFAKIENSCKKQIMNLYKTGKIDKTGRELYVKYRICVGEKKNKARLFDFDNKHTTKDAIEVQYNDDDYTIEYWTPNIKFPVKFYKDRFSYKGVSSVDDFYTKRNLCALSILYEKINSLNLTHKDLFVLAFTNTLLHASKLKSENVRPLSVNNYWIPNDYIEENVWFRFEDRCKNLIKSKKALNSRRTKSVGEYKIINSSALNFENYQVCDYIFTDPPYGDTIQYSELSFIWNAWISKIYETEEEVVINPMQNKKAKEFNELLKVSLTNCYNSLKNNKYFTLCFNNKEFVIWQEVITTCQELGFVLEDIGIYDTYGQSYNKNWSKFSPKSDLYVTFKKTKEIDKSRIINEKFDLNSLCDTLVKYVKGNDVKIEYDKLYDMIIAIIIWNMYYNPNKIDVSKLDTKKIFNIMKNKMNE